MARRRKNHGRAERAGDLLTRAVARIVPGDRLRLTRCQVAWPHLAASNTSRRLRTVSWPVSLRDGILTVVVADSQWLHELSYLKIDLLERLQEQCPGAAVKNMRMRVGSIPAPLVEPSPPESPEPHPLADEPALDTLDALRSVSDPDLRQSIANARMALSRRLRHE